MFVIACEGSGGSQRFPIIMQSAKLVHLPQICMDSASGTANVISNLCNGWRTVMDKKEFLELLLLADEQESMIDRYLERGDMFVLYDNGLKALCVVTREGEGIYEIKNIATVPFFQRQGYGKRLIEFLFEYYQGKCSEMLVGTGDVPSSRSFYEHCGFAISHRIKNFFTDNYDHPMYEDGVQLVDMIYLKKTF